MPRPGGWPPPPDHHRHVTLEPLRSALLELDTAAYLASPDAIRAHSAGRWPTDGFTPEQNLGLIAQHEKEHAAGDAFAYAILDLERSHEIGCAYVRRLDEFLRRTGTRLPGLPDASAMLTFWVIDDVGSRPDVALVLGELLTWVEGWGAAPFVLRALPEETGTIAAIVEHGLREIPAHHQQLPYRWFRRTGAMGPSDMVR